jgi:GTP:adenosylcobinamide-phosphate guanylyltransferase
MRPDGNGRSVPAIVLAGGGADSRLARGLPNKSFLPVHGRPMVSRVADALRGSPSIKDVIAVGPPALQALLGPSTAIVPEQSTWADNIAAALAHLDGERRVLVIASDLPLLTSEAIERFLARCNDGADFYFPLVPRKVIESRLPQAEKTYVRLPGRAVCGGCAALVDPSIAGRLRHLAARAHAARRRRWMLWASMLGPVLLVRLAAGLMTIPAAEARLWRVTGVRGRAIELDAPELAFDVDDESDLRVAEAALAPAGRTLAGVAL